MTSQRVWQVQAHAPGTSAEPTAGRDVVRTTCGREFTVGKLRLEHVGHATARVSLSTPLLSQDVETLWASLTPREARELAGHLLAHAAAAEQAEPAEPMPLRTIEVIYLSPQRYVVRLLGHHPLLTALDDPGVHDGATDLLTASVALELARRAERFLARHETRRDGLRVRAQRIPEGDNRTLSIAIATPPSLNRERRKALQALLSRSMQRDPPSNRYSIEITVN